MFKKGDRVKCILNGSVQYGKYGAVLSDQKGEHGDVIWMIDGRIRCVSSFTSVILENQKQDPPNETENAPTNQPKQPPIVFSEGDIIQCVRLYDKFCGYTATVTGVSRNSISCKFPGTNRTYYFYKYDVLNMSKGQILNTQLLNTDKPIKPDKLRPDYKKSGITIPLVIFIGDNEKLSIDVQNKLLLLGFGSGSNRYAGYNSTGDPQPIAEWSACCVHSSQRDQFAICIDQYGNLGASTLQDFKGSMGWANAKYCKGQEILGCKCHNHPLTSQFMPDEEGKKDDKDENQAPTLQELIENEEVKVVNPIENSEIPW